MEAEEGCEESMVGRLSEEAKLVTLVGLVVRGNVGMIVRSSKIIEIFVLNHDRLLYQLLHEHAHERTITHATDLPSSASGVHNSAARRIAHDVVPKRF